MVFSCTVLSNTMDNYGFPFLTYSLIIILFKITGNISAVVINEFAFGMTRKYENTLV